MKGACSSYIQTMTSAGFGVLNDRRELYTHIIIRDRLYQGQVRSMTADGSISQRF